MSAKIGFISLGCDKNLVDSEYMLGILKKHNYKITNDEEEAEIIIINTCGFINDAKQKGFKIGVFPIIDNDWVDIGEWDEYKKSLNKISFLME